jgi:hypothetical protein
MNETKKIANEKRETERERERGITDNISALKA